MQKCVYICIYIFTLYIYLYRPFSNQCLLFFILTYIFFYSLNQLQKNHVLYQKKKKNDKILINNKKFNFNYGKTMHI